ncbi:transmembrane protein 19 isoform X3 [Ctenocephalides felis]|uniref:transmembrane protein 19 isoform X3 n=1 Tax=Ctenocephalides felis TaxID=7515 RepID=UPI000E6E2B8A|nr:transmembrane protein 19 isoform X3 [Ctenocephalides felis]
MEKSGTSFLYKLLPILLFGLSIPLSMLLWIGNISYAAITNNSEGFSVIPPTRWLVATLGPMFFIAYGLKQKSIDYSGALLGFVTGFLLALSNYIFFTCLIAFFVSSSRATKFRQHLKSKIEDDFKEGGQRNWIQVLCNGGMVTQLSILFILDCGCEERPINFATDYRGSWLSIAVLGAFACCNGDTWASELGTVIGKSEPRLITTLKKVPRGTNGGISVVGLFVSFLGGLLIGLSQFCATILFVDSNILANSPPQWPLILYGGFGGLFGSIIDSLLGATLQYSGKSLRGKIVEVPGANVKHISGRRILDNHSVNLLSSIITALILPVLVNAVHNF